MPSIAPSVPFYPTSLLSHPGVYPICAFGFSESDTNYNMTVVCYHTKHYLVILARDDDTQPYSPGLFSPETPVSSTGPAGTPVKAYRLGGTFDGSQSLKLAVITSVTFDALCQQLEKRELIDETLSAQVETCVNQWHYYDFYLDSLEVRDTFEAEIDFFYYNIVRPTSDSLKASFRSIETHEDTVLPPGLTTVPDEAIPFV